MVHGDILLVLNLNEQIKNCHLTHRKQQALVLVKMENPYK